MTACFDGLSTQRANRTPATGNFEPPAAHGRKLRTRAPEAYHACIFLSLVFCINDFSDHQHSHVRIGVVGQAKLAHSKERVDRRLDMHAGFVIIRRYLRKVWIALRYFR